MSATSACPACRMSRSSAARSLTPAFAASIFPKLSGTGCSPPRTSPIINRSGLWRSVALTKSRIVTAGVVTFPPEAGAVGVDLMAKIVRGEPVTKGVRVPSEYIPPAEVKKYAEMDKPDDWWATKLPAQWLPTH